MGKVTHLVMKYIILDYMRAHTHRHTHTHIIVTNYHARLLNNEKQSTKKTIFSYINPRLWSPRVEESKTCQTWDTVSMISQNFQLMMMIWAIADDRYMCICLRWEGEAKNMYNTHTHEKSRVEWWIYFLFINPCLRRTCIILYVSLQQYSRGEA